MSGVNSQLPTLRQAQGCPELRRRATSNCQVELSRSAERTLGVGSWRLGVVTASAKGFTFIELLVVTTILLILASAVMPLARVTVQRQKEMELRRYLRDMR